MVETPAAGDEGALAFGPVCRREALHLIQRSSATEPDRRVPAIGQQRIEYRPDRNWTMGLRVDQPGVHPVSRGQEAVLGENLGARRER